MCYHRSCIVTEDEKVWFHPQSDHHTQIRALHKIREEDFYEEKGQVALEIVPVRSLFDLDGWEIRIDQLNKPEWFDESVSAIVMEKMVSEFKKRANLNSRSYGGCEEVAIPYLQQYEHGTYITADQSIMLSTRNSGVVNCVFKAKDIVIDFDRIRSHMEPPFMGCTFIAERLHVRNGDSRIIEAYNDIVITDERARYEKSCKFNCHYPGHIND